jgi:microcompartment protein CcmK/EutM
MKAHKFSDGGSVTGRSSSIPVPRRCQENARERRRRRGAARPAAVASLTVIVSAVVCPHPPVLLRELSGLRDVLPDLRAACHDVLRAACSPGVDRVVVAGGAGETRAWDPSLPIGLRRFGTTHARDAECLPQSLGVARRLLDEVGWSGPVEMHAVAWDADPDAVRQVATAVAGAGAGGTVLLLVMADGSASRGERAPGHLDERAAAFDDEIGRGLEAGDPETLTALDAALAADLLVQGRAALAVLGAAVAAQSVRPKSRVVYRDDPFGVMYTVAVWQLDTG